MNKADRQAWKRKIFLKVGKAKNTQDMQPSESVF